MMRANRILTTITLLTIGAAAAGCVAPAPAEPSPVARAPAPAPAPTPAERDASVAARPVRGLRVARPITLPDSAWPAESTELTVATDSAVVVPPRAPALAPAPPAPAPGIRDLQRWGADFFAALQSGEEDRIAGFLIDEASCVDLAGEHEGPDLALALRRALAASIERVLAAHPDLRTARLVAFEHDAPGYAIHRGGLRAVFDARLVYEVRGDDRRALVVDAVVQTPDGRWWLEALEPVAEEPAPRPR